ncbi:MAG: hypothetical protein HC812_20265 [Leptolyngbya sp. RL_3_1]|nr:hypothetical protein [Leptolyngbya sp. RL_3_1]
MTTHPIHSRHQPDFSRTSILGLIFFMLGAPHLYAFLKRPATGPQLSGVTRYALMALVAGAIASLVELSIV